MADRAAGAEREAARAEARELRARIENLERAPRQSLPQQFDGPDMFADPTGWWATQRAGIIAEVRVMLANASFADAAHLYGQRFQDAFAALCATQPENPARTRIQIAANPGRELLLWHKEQQVLAKYASELELD